MKHTDMAYGIWHMGIRPGFYSSNECSVVSHLGVWEHGISVLGDGHIMQIDICWSYIFAYASERGRLQASSGV